MHDPHLTQVYGKGKSEKEQSVGQKQRRVEKFWEGEKNCIINNKSCYIPLKAFLCSCVLCLHWESTEEARKYSVQSCRIKLSDKMKLQLV